MTDSFKVVAGWAVMIVSIVVGCYVLYTAIMLLYLSYAASTLIPGRDVNWIYTLIHTIVKLGVVYACYLFFDWGKHLKTPGSTEYV